MIHGFGAMALPLMRRVRCFSPIRMCPGMDTLIPVIVCSLQLSSYSRSDLPHFNRFITGRRLGSATSCSGETGLLSIAFLTKGLIGLSVRRGGINVSLLVIPSSEIDAIQVGGVFAQVLCVRAVLSGALSISEISTAPWTARPSSPPSPRTHRCCVSLDAPSILQ
jgi:hypothetical protein